MGNFNIDRLPLASSLDNNDKVAVVGKGKNQFDKTVKVSDLTTAVSGDSLSLAGGTITGDITKEGIGTAGTNVTATHYTSGGDVVTELTITNATISIAAAAGQGDGILIFTFPAGAYYITSTYLNITLQGGGTIDADTPEIGVGTAQATGAISILGSQPASEDRIQGVAAADCNGTASELMDTPAGSSAPFSLSTGAKTMYLNVADSWAGTDTLTINGTVSFKWCILA